MAHPNKVVRSIESPCGTRCVDIYKTPEGAYGFAEYRRDPEDPAGWRLIGAESASTYRTEAGALAEARRLVGWLGAMRR